MKTDFKKNFFVLLALCLFHCAKAQVFSNEMSALDKINVYKVVTFEEFVHRFNNDAKSNIRLAYRFYKVAFKIKRPALIRSLFDYESKSLDTAAITSFAAAAADTRTFEMLDPNASLFAEAICRFRYHGTDVDIPVILHYVSDANNGSKWMIEGVGHHPVVIQTGEHHAFRNKKVLRFINPVNNEANFTDLNRVFEDKLNLQDYFEQELFTKPAFLSFYDGVINRELQFLYVKEIRYHALQYKDWIFTVKEFRRNTLNSGWLINKLVRVNTPEEKKQYLKILMGE